MKIYLASDHTGIELKTKVKNFLEQLGSEVVDCGAYEYNKDDDYPDFISKASENVSHDPENNRGIVMGGSGQGEAMVANKYKGVRCALFYTPCVATSTVDATGRISTDPFEVILLSREHNNSNMLSLGVRFLRDEDALTAVKLWLDTDFKHEERHERRVEKIKRLEQNA